MGKYIRSMVVALVALGLVSSLWGATRAVPEDYSKIMDAIQDANNGDTVSVRPGTVEHPDTFVEQINFLGKDLLVTARNQGWQNYGDVDNPDPRATVIDISPILNSLPPDFRSVVYMNPSTHGELRGFTITGGTGTSESALNATVAGGIYVKNSLHDVLNRLIVTNNRIEGSPDNENTDTMGMGGHITPFEDVS